MFSHSINKFAAIKVCDLGPSQNKELTNISGSTEVHIYIYIYICRVENMRCCIAKCESLLG